MNIRIQLGWRAISPDRANGVGTNGVARISLAGIAPPPHLATQCVAKWWGGAIPARLILASPLVPTPFVPFRVPSGRPPILAEPAAGQVPRAQGHGEDGLEQSQGVVA